MAGEGGSGGKPWWLIHLLGPSNADPETGKPLYEDECRTPIRRSLLLIICGICVVLEAAVLFRRVKQMGGTQIFV